MGHINTDRYTITTEQLNDSFSVIGMACRVIRYETGMRPDKLHWLQIQLDVIEHTITYYEFNEFEVGNISRRTEIFQIWLSCEGLEDHTETTMKMINSYNITKSYSDNTKRDMLKILEAQGF